MKPPLLQEDFVGVNDKLQQRPIKTDDAISDVHLAWQRLRQMHLTSPNDSGIPRNHDDTLAEDILVPNMLGFVGFPDMSGDLRLGSSKRRKRSSSRVLLKRTEPTEELQSSVTADRHVALWTGFRFPFIYDPSQLILNVPMCGPILPMTAVLPTRWRGTTGMHTPSLFSVVIMNVKRHVQVSQRVEAIAKSYS